MCHCTAVCIDRLQCVTLHSGLYRQVAMCVTLHSGLYRQVAMCLSLCTVVRIDRLQCVCHCTVDSCITWQEVVIAVPAQLASNTSKECWGSALSGNVYQVNVPSTSNNRTSQAILI